jgi:hypothetical protein
MAFYIEICYYIITVTVSGYIHSQYIQSCDTIITVSLPYLPYQLALQPFVGLGLLHQQPPSILVHHSGSTVM